jgi:hypothetical protein
MKTDIEKLEELEALAKAVNAAPLESLRKCEALLEERVQDRIADGETEIAARTFVLSDRDSIGSRLYKLHCDLTEQVAFNEMAFLG